MKKIMILALLYSFPALAQTQESIIPQGKEPTIVYGSAATPSGKNDTYTVEQPADAPNPLGNPIVPDANPQPIYPDNVQEGTSPTNSSATTDTNTMGPDETPDTLSPMSIVNQSAEQNPAPFSESPEQQQNQIQNTLYQGGNRIYDVQSFPVNDINEITEPNIQPTITTYPEY